MRAISIVHLLRRDRPLAIEGAIAARIDELWLRSDQGS
jgi:hypothetical protein